jgi:transcriptional antiterminator NusG
MNKLMEKKEISNMKWYIVRAASNREKSVSEKIEKEGEKGDLMGKIGKVIVPVEKSFHLKNGKKVIREKVMYPGYIFIETNAVGELKYYLKGLNGASGFLTARSGEVQSLTQTEVDRMLGVQKEKEIIAEQFNYFINGESVKILDGPFNNFIGTVDSVKDQKVKVEVMIFGRKNLIELNSSQIEKHNG